MATRRSALLAILVSGLMAQPSQAQSPQSPEPPVFPAQAEVVRMDLVVRDKAGRLVEDLHPDEVIVLEDGKPCAVQSFRLVRAEEPAAATGASAPAPARAASAPAPAPAASESLATVVALVFDQLGTEAARNARAAALELTHRTFPKGSVFAVFKIGQQFEVLQPFTPDRSLLASAIEKATKGVDRAQSPAALHPEYDNATEEALAITRRAQQATGMEKRFLEAEARMLRFADAAAREGEGQASLQPLIAIARGLALVQGRKSLLYFSEGLAVPSSIEETFRAAVSAANRANVSVYAFDARGLRVRAPTVETKLALGVAQAGAFDAQQPSSPSSGTVRQDQPGGAPSGGVDASELAQDALRMNRQAVLGDLAESTGGFLVAETNDLRPGIERVVADLRAYYDLGYAPPPGKADGKWRSIEVKVTRPGVVVRARRGYLALPPGSPVVLPRELPLAEALVASPMPRDLDLRAAVLRFVGAGPETEALVWVEVPLAGVTLAPGEATYAGRVSLLGQVTDEKGELVARLTHEAVVEGPVAEVPKARGGTTIVKRALRLPPGRYSLAIAGQDPASGRLGARRVGFEIPAAETPLRLGSVAIVRADDAAEEVPPSVDPLRAGSLKATPLLGRAFPEGTGAISLLLSLYADPGAARPEVDLEFRRDGQAVARAKPDLPAPDASGRITYIGSLPTAGLAVGRYEVWVRGHLGEAEATEATAFTIEPRAGVAAATAGVGPMAAAAGPGSIEDKKGVAVPLATILERAGRYVLEYESTFSNLVAEETYRQWGPDPRTNAGMIARTLRSDLVFARLTGPLPWGTFRDVYECDGQKVRDRESRLEKLLFSKKRSDFEQAQAILNESSRFNLGRAHRNVNTPTLGLLFLRPDNQKRLAFRRKGTRTIAGFPTVEVAFEEKASPSLVHDRWTKDVPASGRFWIDETRGAVLRTEIEYDLETEKTKASVDSWERGLVSTEYRRDVTIGSLVPDSMTELYNLRGIGRVEGTARYGNYRRFEVATGSAAALPITFGRDAVAASGGEEAAPGVSAGQTSAAGVPAAAPPTRPQDAWPEPPPAAKAVADLPMVDAPEAKGALGALLQKAGDYVLRYQQSFRDVVAEERYEQKSNVREPLRPRLGSSMATRAQAGFAENPRDALAADAQSRSRAQSRGPGEAAARVRSEVVFTMLPGPVPFTLLRDVLEADERVLRASGRLEPLFRSSPASALREAAGITVESEKLILGPSVRTLSVPTVPLAYLQPDLRDSFAFKRRGPDEIRGEEVVELTFEEVGRPTLAQDGAGRDLPIRGSFWIRERDGAVLRTRTVLAFGEAAPDAPRGSLTATTDYVDDAALGLLAPREMAEVLEWRVSGLRLDQVGSVDGRARYSGFRRIGNGSVQ